MREAVGQSRGPAADGLLSVVIPNFNGQSTIAATLRSVESQLPAASEIVVVDDASLDDSLGVIERVCPRARIVCNSSNQGAAASRNHGTQVAHGQLILFVDADVTLEQNAVSELLIASRQADIAFPTVMYSNGSVMYPVNTVQAQYPLVSPAFLIRRSSLERMAGRGFDETIGIYGEDVDFFLRAYLSHLVARHVPAAVAVHNVKLRGKNREQRYFLEMRNVIRGLIKFGGIAAIGRLDHAFTLRNVLRLLVCGLFNFNLFDMQARGYAKYGGLARDLRHLLGPHDTISDRGRAVVIALTLRAIWWNVRYSRETVRDRRCLHATLQRDHQKPAVHY